MIDKVFAGACTPKLVTVGLEEALHSTIRYCRI